MFGLNLRRSSPPPPSERSRFVGASLTSTGIRAVLIGTGSVRSLQLDDPHSELPLAVKLERKLADVGYAALAVSRIAPHSVCSHFLGQLNTAQEWRNGKVVHSPETALALCLDETRKHLDTDALGLALPTYLSAKQLRSLLELLDTAKWPVRGSVSVPLAIAAHRASSMPTPTRGSEPTVLIVDADHHAFTASLVSVGTNAVKLLGTQSVPKASLRFWTTRLLDGLSDRCVRICRRDPRDSAEAEQDLFHQLEPALDLARQGNRINFTLRSEHWFQDLPASPDDLEAICEPINRLALEGLKQLLLSSALAAPPRAVWLTEKAGRLPGLAAKLYKHSPEQTQVSLLPATAAAEAAAALVPRWLTGHLPRHHLDELIPLERPRAAPEVITTSVTPKSSRAALPSKTD